MAFIHGCLSKSAVYPISEDFFFLVKIIQKWYCGILLCKNIAVCCIDMARRLLTVSLVIFGD